MEDSVEDILEEKLATVKDEVFTETEEVDAPVVIPSKEDQISSADPPPSPDLHVKDEPVANSPAIVVDLTVDQEDSSIQTICEEVKAISVSSDADDTAAAESQPPSDAENADDTDLQSVKDAEDTAGTESQLTSDAEDVTDAESQQSDAEVAAASESQPTSDAEDAVDAESQSAEQQEPQMVRFHCSFCTSSYSRRTRLHMHVRKVHPDQYAKYISSFARLKVPSIDSLCRKQGGRYFCRCCVKNYSRGDNLRAHIKQAHPHLLPGSPISTSKYCAKKLKKKLIKTSNENSVKKHLSKSAVKLPMFRTNIFEKLSNLEDCGSDSSAAAIEQELAEKYSDFSLDGIDLEEHRIRCFETVYGAPVLGCIRVVKLVCDNEPSANNFWIIRQVVKARKPQPTADMDGNDASERNVCKVAKKHECPACREKFAFQRQLDEHMKQHRTNGGVACLKCHKWFRNNAKLRRHSFSHTGERNFKCFICGKAFIYLDNKTRHEKNCSAKQFDCKKQGESKGKDKTPPKPDIVKPVPSTKDKPNLSFSNGTNTKFTCDACGEICRDSYHLQSHKKRHFSKHGLKCLTCFKCFPGRYKLFRHMVVHTREKRFKCHRCNEAFYYPHYLSKHLKDCTKRPVASARTKCIYCDQTFSMRNNMWRHVRRVHRKQHAQKSAKPPAEPPSSGSHHCLLCDSAFSNQKDLQSHVTLHRNGKFFKCTYCSKPFLYQSKLFRHLLMHKQRFIQSSTFQTNLTKPAIPLKVEKSKQCSLCMVKFSSWSNLWRHKRNVHSHGKRKNFTEIKNSKRVETNQTTKRVETNQSTETKVNQEPSNFAQSLLNSEFVIYKCRYCDGTFTVRDELRAHVRSQHEAQRRENHDLPVWGSLSCRLCNKTYQWYKNIRRHFGKHHTDQFKKNTCQNPNKNPKTSAKISKVETPPVVGPNTQAVEKKLDENSDFKCGACGLHFTSAMELQTHAKKHVTSRGFKCLFCPKHFPNKHKLYRHVIVHTKEKRFKCQKCGEAFLYQEYLKVHAKKCRKQLELDNSLNDDNAHQDYSLPVQNSPEPKIELPSLTSPIKSEPDSSILNDTSETESKDVSQQSLDTAEQSSPSKCGACGLTFPSSSELKCHEKKHITSNGYKCLMCPKFFPNKHKLFRHIVVHTKEKRFKCDNCGELFLYQGYLRIHRKVCVKEMTVNVLAPPQVNKQKKDTESLPGEKDPTDVPVAGNKCALSPSNVKPASAPKGHVCDMCSKEFLLEGQLARHKAKHRQAKLYKCLTCSKTFHKKGQLVLHYSKVHLV